MTREIKFRAWDGERLRNVNYMGWVDGELNDICTSKYNGPAEEFELMQYIGLKDHGVEVYEDDIIKFTNNDFVIVKFFEGHYIAVGVYKGKKIARDEFNMSIESALRTGVLVGNVHEDYELLEGNK